MMEYLCVPGTEPDLLYGEIYRSSQQFFEAGIFPISIPLQIKTLRFKDIK